MRDSGPLPQPAPLKVSSLAHRRLTYGGPLGFSCTPGTKGSQRHPGWRTERWLGRCGRNPSVLLRRWYRVVKPHGIAGCRSTTPAPPECPTRFGRWHPISPVDQVRCCPRNWRDGGSCETKNGLVWHPDEMITVVEVGITPASATTPEWNGSSIPDAMRTGFPSSARA